MLIMLPFTWSGGAEATPNAKSRGASGPADIYFTCITATMASFRRWHPNAQLVLAVDVAPPQPFEEQLQILGVRTHLGPFAHRPPAGFTPRFATSLYLLDALHSARAVPGWDRLVVIDPDLLCMEPLDRPLAALDRAAGSVGAMPIDYPIEHNVNGLNRREAAGIATDLDGAAAAVAPHYGGEFLVVPRERLDQLLDRTEHAWADALDRFRSGSRHFVTEEHFVSYALRDLEVTDMSPFVRRIWTAPSYRTVAGDEHELTLWHLPAEKRRGFTALHAAAMDRDSWWWASDRDGFRARVGTAVGIPRRRPGRFAYDLTRGTAARIRRTGRWMVGVARGTETARGAGRGGLSL